MKINSLNRKAARIPNGERKTAALFEGGSVRCEISKSDGLVCDFFHLNELICC